MAFIKPDLTPILNKLYKKILAEKNKIRISEFDKELSKIRLTKDDRKQILKLLGEKGYIHRQGKNIYVLHDNDYMLNNTGRPNILSEKEIKLAKQLYKPNKYNHGYRKIAEIINKKRIKENKKPVSHMTIKRNIETVTH